MPPTVRPGAAACVVAALLVIACDNASDSSPLRSLEVTPNPLTLETGDTVRLGVTPLDGNGNLVVGVAVVFESADTSVATVSVVGTVTARHKGTTTIIVSSGEDVATLVPLTVTAPIVAVFVGPADTTINQGATAQLRVGLIDSEGDTVPGAIVWSSSDAAVATVNNSGRVTSTGLAGEVFIVAQHDFYSASTHITVPEGAILARLPLDGAPNFIDIHGNTALVGQVSLNRVVVLNLVSTAFIDTITTGLVPCGIVFNNAGTVAYVANQFSDNVGIINVTGGTQSSAVSVTGDPLPVALPPTDTVLFVTTNVNRLFKIDLATNTVADSSLPLPATSHHLLAHPNDTLLYVATRDGGTVMEVNWRTMTIVRTFPVGGQPLDIIIAPDRSELYVANGQGMVHTINLATGAIATTLIPAGASTIELSPDGSQLYVGMLFSGRIRVLNRTTRAYVKTIVTGGVIREMRRDIPRNRVVVTNENGWVDFVR